MAVIKTALVLVCCACATLAWENLPQIPANRRAEYHLQHDDGAYKYGYDTGEGQSAVVNADATNQVVGQWQYVDNDGQRVNWQYTSGDAGYVPVMTTVTGGGAAIRGQGIGGGAGHGTGNAAGRGVGKGIGHEVVSQVSSNHGSDTGSSSSSSVDADYDENADASYAFNINTDEYKRTESADNKGNVKGEYSYNSAIGGNHAISYEAGAGRGFVVTKTTSEDGSAGRRGSGSSSGSYSGQQIHQQRVAVPVAHTPYSGPAADVNAQHNPDGSFSYSYTTGDHSHQAMGDAQNNVQGSYTFTAKDDGKQRTVNYHAGSKTGFVATGDHLPVAPQVPVVDRSAGQNNAWAAQTKTNQQSWSGQQVSQSAIGVHPKTVEPSNAETIINPDGSYSFSYTTNDHSRQESADAKNNVRGTYSWNGDGQSRRIDYHAGADTGFVATGDGLNPVPEVKSQSKNVWSNDQSTIDHHSVAVHAANTQQSWSANSADQSNQQVNNGPVDASYAFSYQADDHSRNEAADAQGNVKGTFSFTADDGVVRMVDYTAGAEQGFIANGAHIPVAPELVAPSQYTKSVSGGSAWSAQNSGNAGSQQQFAQSVSETGGQQEDNGDASYSYSYETDSSSKQETSDAKGNVVGSFQYVDANGEQRKLTYTAKDNEGFIASGDHLPVAGVVPVVKSTQSGSVWASKTTGNTGSSAWNAGQIKQVSSPHVARADDSALNQKNDGSYSYSYTTGDQSVQQTADTDNNVQGSYSFKAKDDGKTRTVNWIAGSQTGFVATGDHLPVAPVAGAVPVASGASAWTAKTGSSGSGAWSGQTSSTGSVWGSQSGGAVGVKTAPAPWSANNGAAVVKTSGPSNDGSYSYSYSTDTQNVQQSSDANNNVMGTYSFKAKDDGKLRTVNWQAGSKTGFVAQGDHLPVAPVAGSLEARLSALPAQSPGIKGAHYGGGSSSHVSHSGAGSQGVKSNSGQSHGQSDDQSSGDASYSYSYKTDSSAKEESSDAKGNVVGSFTYLGGDGVSRKLSYTARKEDGFMANGDHLPVAPSVGSASSGVASHGSGIGTQQSRPYAPLPVVRSHGAGQTQGHSVTSSSSQSHGHGQESRDGNVVITKYLPPVSQQKYGYIFDTKA